MIVFYSELITDDFASIIGEEARHCSKVLRKKIGDLVDFTDGKGFFYKGKLIDITKDECRLQILDIIQSKSPSYELTIAISPVKNPSRFEWFIEKSVEIGISKIIPLICKRTEKIRIKTSRIQKIIISASKQSLKAKFAELSPPLTFDELLEQIQPTNTYIANLRNKAKYLGTCISPNSDSTILIGPEGDFTENEIEKALMKEVIPVTLGTSRLRTETAGVVACQIVNVVNEMDKY